MTGGLHDQGWTRFLCPCVILRRFIFISILQFLVIYDKSYDNFFAGCPFKHSDPEILRKRLQMYKFPKEKVDEVRHLLFSSVSQKIYFKKSEVFV